MTRSYFAALSPDACNHTAEKAAEKTAGKYRERQRKCARTDQNTAEQAEQEYCGDIEDIRDARKARRQKPIGQQTDERAAIERMQRQKRENPEQKMRGASLLIL